MKKASNWLLDYKKDIFSQTGEDGIIEKIFKTLPVVDGWCVEFGAWDGVFLSNTANLIKNKAYSAVLIEGDFNKYVELKQNYINSKSVFPVNSFVGFSSDDNLDSILHEIPIPANFDLLSIDIDGNDYHVWKAISAYSPKVVVIEFNQTMPTEVRFVQEANLSVSHGSSLLSLVELGKEKGYELVSVLHCNAFFVKAEYFDLFEISNNSPVNLRCSLEDITYLFSGYDGKVIIQGGCRLPWHGVEIEQSSLQQLPKIFQQFPTQYSKTTRVLFAMYRAWKKMFVEPLVIIKKIYSRIMRFIFKVDKVVK